MIIQRGFRDQTYGMPLVALGANLSWEFIFSFVHPHRVIQRSINIVWTTFDLVILFQTLRYGWREFPDLSRRIFYALISMILAISFCLVLFICYEMLDFSGMYAAFEQNLLMSIIFITMLYQRKSLRGQSLTIAICKMIGTLLASLGFYFYVASMANSVILPFICAAILVFDLLYIGLCPTTGEFTKKSLPVTAIEART